MSSLQSFLDWFGGWSENIDGAPNPKQWERLVDRIKAIQPEPSNMPIIRETVGKPFSEPRKPTTNAAWMAQYLDAMLDQGIDPDTAKDYRNGRAVDLAVDPRAEADRDAKALMTG